MTNNEGLKADLIGWLKLIYTDIAAGELISVAEIIEKRVKRNSNFSKNISKEKWSEKSCLLISYGDSVSGHGRAPIGTLNNFTQENMEGLISCIHILPFFPSSGDDGFSVKDYSSVNPKLGTWKDISAISDNFLPMADVILNHGSRESAWFEQFLDSKSPGRDFFFTVSDAFNISKVVRPREHALLQEVETKDGIKKIWCTFSEDQVDFNFTNPLVLLEFIQIILDFIDNGIKILRLDAVGFLWKKSGTGCLNLQETHSIIKLIRNITDVYQEDTIIVTETNLPNQENLSYFGNGNEAHWIYNFPLPPLVLYTLLFADSTILRRWSMSMPPALKNTSYLNFLSSHDGFGMRPIEGLLDEEQKSKLFARLENNGSLFSWRHNNQGDKSVYEANTTLFSALEKTDVDPEGHLSILRFISAYAIIFSFEGIPAIYINSFFGMVNDLNAVQESGIKRRVNRQKFSEKWLKSRLDNVKTREHKIFNTLKKLLKIRSQQTAFHPNATQFTLQLGTDFFGLWRQSRDRTQSIFAITNLNATDKNLNLLDINLIDTENWRDLISGINLSMSKNSFKMSPYQTVWITNK